MMQASARGGEASTSQPSSGAAHARAAGWCGGMHAAPAAPPPYWQVRGAVCPACLGKGGGSLCPARLVRGRRLQG